MQTFRCGVCNSCDWLDQYGHEKLVIQTITQSCITTCNPTMLGFKFEGHVAHTMHMHFTNMHRCESHKLQGLPVFFLKKKPNGMLQN